MGHRVGGHNLSGSKRRVRRRCTAAAGHATPGSPLAAAGPGKKGSTTVPGGYCLHIPSEKVLSSRESSRIEEQFEIHRRWLVQVVGPGYNAQHRGVFAADKQAAV